MTEIKEFFDNWKNKNKGFRDIEKNISDSLKIKIEESTNFLPLDSSWKKRLWHCINEKYEIQKCTYCEDSKKFDDNSISHGYRPTCGKVKCAKQAEKQTCINKYGVESIMSVPEYQEKFKKTHLERYGHSSFLSTPVAKSAKEKKKKDDILIRNPEIISISEDNLTIKILCTKCKEEKEIGRRLYIQRKSCKDFQSLCLDCKPISGGSSFSELQIVEFIHSIYSGAIISKYRYKGGNSEIDIYLPELKIGFEFNGVYWHSEIYKDSNYHIEKTNELQELGINLIHIWQDDWNFKQDIVKSIIRNKVKNNAKSIFARKCFVKEIPNKLAKEFCNINHLSAGINSKWNYGLYYQDQLVSVMTFGKSRIVTGLRNDKIELLRFCNLLEHNVIGGAGKLLKFFIRKEHPIEIFSYANRDISNGNLYQKIGFNFVKYTKPNYYWIVDEIKRHRFEFRKDVLVKQGFDKEKTETEIMHQRGYSRVFNSGNILFEMKC